MKTSVVEMQHRTGTKVRLIGMAHIGTEDFYNKVESLLEGKVLYEMVKSKSKEKSSLAKAFKLFSAILDLKFQGGYLKPKDDWVNADLSKEDLMFCDESAIPKMEPDKLEALEDFEEGAKENKEILKFILIPLIRLILFIKKHKAEQGKIIVDLRNNKAVLDIIKYAQENDQLSVTYGEAHIRGIAEQLKHCGYKVTNTYKLRAF